MPQGDIRMAAIKNRPVTMTIEAYERLSDPLERLLDETDEYCRIHPEREDGEAMFKRIRDRRSTCACKPTLST